MKISTVLMKVFAVITVIIIDGVFYIAFHNEPLSLYVVSMFILVLGFFISTVYFARESGKGEPMNFLEILRRHGDNTEWEILAQGLCSNSRWTGFISETRSEKKYFVYFSKKDIPCFEKNIGKLNKYFHTQIIFQDSEFKYHLYTE